MSDLPFVLWSLSQLIFGFGLGVIYQAGRFKSEIEQIRALRREYLGKATQHEKDMGSW